MVRPERFDLRESPTGASNVRFVAQNVPTSRQDTAAVLTMGTLVLPDGTTFTMHAQKPYATTLPQAGPRVYLRGQTWWCDLRLPDGTRRRVTTGETDQDKAQLKAEKLALELGAPARSHEMTLLEALEDTYANHWHGTKSAVIVRRVCNVIIRDVGYLKLSEVTFNRMESYCKGLLQDGLKAATVNRRMSTIGTALTRCVKKGWLPARPPLPHHAENNIKERYLTKEEEAAIFTAFEPFVRRDEALGHYDYTLVRDLAILLLDSGMRFSEALKFTLDADGHINLMHGETKNSKGRRVPLTKRALVAAKALLASRKYRELQTMEGKKPWDFCSHRWGTVTKLAGCPEVTLHILRHTTASRLVQKGIPIYTVSKWLGHSSVRITERYAKLAPDTLGNALAALEEEPA